MTPASRRFALTAAALVVSIVGALSPSPAEANTIVDVYRFWSPVYNNAHFYTTDASEAAQIRDTNSNWVDEGVAFKARAASSGGCSVGTPVYRFWSAGYRTHFYTADKSESDQVRATNRNWVYEGIAYCADSGPQNGGTPLYRFWSPAYRNHFYTADKAESDQIRETNRNWTYEGIAYYVNPGPTPTPTPTTPAPSNLLPAQVLNLTKWKITLPTGSDNNPTEVKQTALSMFEISPWFETMSNTDTSQGVRFRANAGGATTDLSDYPRSELREMADGTGNTVAGWSNASSSRAMTVTQAITALPTNKRHVIAGQIHGGTDIGGPVIYVRLEGSTLFVQRGSIVTNSAQFVPIDNETLTSRYALGTKFTVRFEAGPTLVNGGPGVQVKYWAGTNTNLAPTKTVRYTGTTGNTTYFKAGCYTQSNTTTDAASAYGEVVIYPPLTVTP